MIDLDQHPEDEPQAEVTGDSEAKPAPPKVTLSADDKKRLYSTQLLATLSIPYLVKPEDEFQIQYNFQKDRELEFARLLQYDGPVNRSFILQDAVANDILSKVYPEVESLYTALEGKFRPFQLHIELDKVLKIVDSHDDLKQYRNTIIDATFVKLLIQISSVYETIQIPQISKLMPCLSALDIERRIVDAIQAGTVECCIDHRTGIIRFVSTSFESPDLRNKLSSIAINMRKCIDLISPDRKNQIADQRRQKYIQIAANLKAEHQKYKERRVLIQKIREMREQIKETEKAAKLEEDKRRKKSEEEAAAAAAIAAPPPESVAPPAASTSVDVEKLKQTIIEVGQSMNIAIKPELLADLKNPDDIYRKAALLMAQQRKKKEETLNSLATRLDYLIRAEREIEIPLLKEREQKEAAEEKEFWKDQQEKVLKKQKEQYEGSLATRQRLAKMTESRNQYEKLLQERKRPEFEAKLREREKKVEEWRAQKVQKREEEEKEKEEKEQEEKRAEEERLKNEEEERKAAEKKKKLEKKKPEEPEAPPEKAATRRPVGQTTAESGKATQPAQPAKPTQTQPSQPGKATQPAQAAPQSQPTQPGKPSQPAQAVPTQQAPVPGAVRPPLKVDDAKSSKPWHSAGSAGVSQPVTSPREPASGPRDPARPPNNPQVTSPRDQGMGRLQREPGSFTSPRDQGMGRLQREPGSFTSPRETGPSSTPRETGAPPREPGSQPYRPPRGDNPQTPRGDFSNQTPRGTSRPWSTAGGAPPSSGTTGPSTGGSKPWAQGGGQGPSQTPRDYSSQQTPRSDYSSQQTPRGDYSQQRGDYNRPSMQGEQRRPPPASTDPTRTEGSWRKGPPAKK